MSEPVEAGKFSIQRLILDGGLDKEDFDELEHLREWARENANDFLEQGKFADACVGIQAYAAADQAITLRRILSVLNDQKGIEL